jgi:hypothetical protein
LIAFFIKNEQHIIMDQDKYCKSRRLKRVQERKRQYLKEKARKKREKWLPEGVDYKPSYRKPKNGFQGPDENIDNDNDYNGCDANYNYLCQQWHDFDRMKKKQVAAEKFEEDIARRLELTRRYEVAQARYSEFNTPSDEYYLMYQSKSSHSLS